MQKESNNGRNSHRSNINFLLSLKVFSFASLSACKKVTVMTKTAPKPPFRMYPMLLLPLCLTT